MRIYAFLLLFCGLAATVCAQYPAAAIAPEYLVNAHTVIRERTCIFRVTSADQAEIEEHIVMTILNKDGIPDAIRQEGETEFNKVKVLEGTLYNAAGTLLRNSKKQDVREYGSSPEFEFADHKVKVLDLQDSQFPFTVEFHVRNTIKGFFRVPEFVVQELGQSVLKSSYSIVAPASYSFRWKGFQTDVQPVMSEATGEKTSTWTFKNLPAVPKESSHPYFNNAYCRIIISPAQVLIDGYKGNFSNWQQMGAFFFELNKSRDVVSPQMKEKVLHMVGNQKTTREKIETIYRYLQQNYRYVSIQIGIGGWQTLDAGFVEQKKYGDCKALTNYMQAMLKVAGIRSYAADIYAGTNACPEWHDDTPIPYANHVILYVPDEDMWLECTSNSNPAGYLGSFTAGRKALLLTPEGGKVVATPALTVADNTQTTHTAILLEETGAAEVKSSIQATCEMQETFRAWSVQLKQPDIEKYFVEKAEFPIAQLQSLKVSASESLPKADVQYALKTNNIATKSGKRMFIPVNKINPYKRTLPANDKRMLDLKLDKAYTWRDTVILNLPAGFSVENMPPAKHIESEFGLYDLQTVKLDDAAVQVIRHVEMKPVSVPASRYNEVRQFFSDVTKADGAQMVLVKN